MNKTKIDWADMTWNPVTGCLHECEYCYARKIANRFGRKYMPFGDEINVQDKPFDGCKGIDPYPFGFEPTLHKYRLDEPKKIKKQQNIFVCSMADLFGKWVPDEWIEEVFRACEAAPQHRYLFLTKNVQRYPDIKYKGDIWLGNTVTKKSDFIREYGRPNGAKRFISIEPIMEHMLIPFGNAKWYGWVIVGAETGNRKGKVIPEKQWIDDIASQCARYRVPIFMKESLKDLMGDDFRQEFPWEVL